MNNPCKKDGTSLMPPNSLNQYTSISNLCASVPPHEGTNPVNPVNPVQESSAPPSAFAYDADGNMTADERGWHYAWNGENRMICASNDEVVVTYAYDHRGRMVRKSICHLFFARPCSNPSVMFILRVLRMP